MDNIPILYNSTHTKYAVLVSHGFGAGWSTFNQMELAYDKRVIELWEKYHEHQFVNGVDEEIIKAITDMGYEEPYLGGFFSCGIHWVSIGRACRIVEYDGNETLEFADEIKWIKVDE